MGEQIVQFDWGSTALGPLPRWQPSLRIAVDMMLLSPFPSAVVWGSNLTVIPNDAYLALHRSVPRIVGIGFDKLWHEPWEKMGPWVFKALEGRSSFVEDEPLQLECSSKGSEGWFAFSYSPIRDDNGDVAGFLHTVIDTTASVAAHRDWREMARTFEKQIEHYMADRERIWQLSLDPMIIVSLDMKLLAANPAWHRVLGWSEAEIKDVPILDLVHPADHNEVQQAVLDFVHSKGPDQLDTRVQHRDGHYRWIRWCGTFDGRVLTGVGRDITGEREEAMRQSEALMRNSHRLEAVGQWAGGMTHQINNLLSGIGGSLELLQHRLGQGRLENLDNYVELARDSVQRAMSLTHRLLAFSSGAALTPRPLLLNQQVTNLEPLLRQTLGPEINLQWHLDVAPWAVCLDLPELENALIHLCANSREACLQPGRVTISSVNERLQAPFPDEDGLPPGDYVALHVEDEGHGMSAEEVARAFEPFFTSKPVGRGSGLGLSMVYGFVRQSGGYAWIESSPAHGTKVSMLFPRSFEPVVQEPAVAPPLVSLAKGQRLLLVEDETSLRSLMCEFLGERGFDVIDVADANSALAKFHHDGPFDLVITDIGLPGGFSGRQLAKALRTLEPQQKILFITGYTHQAVEQQLLDEPGTALLLKPFLLQNLASQALQMVAG
ncbi:PAS domain S-box protein [Pseudomonas putida]